MDAQVLSEVSCRIDLPSVHIPSEVSRRRKTLCGMREALVGTRTKLINTVRGWLRGQGVHVRTGRASTFGDRVRAMRGNGLPAHVVRQLTAIDAISVEIAEADRDIAQEAVQDEVCRRLITVPGIGAVTAIRFAAALDGVDRFADAHKVESYLGLVPGENSSSEHQYRLSITKAGPASMRWALVQAAWSLQRCKKAEAMPLKAWAQRIAQRRGKNIATVALARKLAGILYAIWRDGSVYDGALSAKKI